MFMNVERKHVIAVIACAVLFIIVLIAHQLIVGKFQAPYDAVVSETAALQSQIDVASASQYTQTQQQMRRTSGVDNARIETDKQVFSDLIATFGKWESMSEYKSTSNEVKKNYTTSGNISFLNAFLPDLPDNAPMSQVNRTYTITDTILTNAAGRNYNYIVLVDIGPAEKSKEDNEVRHAVALVTVDDDGQIIRLEGATLAQ